MSDPERSKGSEETAGTDQVNISGGPPQVGVVLPPDTRVRVANSTAQPTCWIGQLETQWPDGPGIGTATLVGSRHLVTCAHNFFDPMTKKFCTSARFRPAANRSAGGAPQVPYGHFDVKHMHVTDEYKIRGAPAPPAGGILPRDVTKYLSDYAVAELTHDIPDIPGESMLRVYWPGDGVVNNLACDIDGYSGDLDPTGHTMYTRNGNVNLFSSGDLIQYRMSTYNGDSGAPVFAPAQGGRPYWDIVGIHVTGVDNDPPGAANGFNFAVALNGDVLRWILEHL